LGITFAKCICAESVPYFTHNALTLLPAVHDDVQIRLYEPGTYALYEYDIGKLAIVEYVSCALGGVYAPA
jgi:hypothetical protein